MKSFILIIITFGFFACGSDSSVKTEKNQETVSISGTETLEFHLASGIPVEGGFSIAEQAEHYVLSEIQYRDKGVFYVYTPEAGFTGTDIVEIKREDSDGAKVYAETITTLNIKVTE